MAKFDTREIRRDNPLNTVAAARGVKLQVNGREWKALCPFHAEDTPSFTIFTGRDKDQRFHCYGCGAHGDVIDFVAEYHGLDAKRDFNEVCEILGGQRTGPKHTPPPAEAFDPYAGYKILFPPEGTPPILAGKASPPILNPKRLAPDGKPTSVTYRNVKYAHAYRDAAGKLAGYVLRIEFEDRKITPCILWGENKATGFAGWMHGSMPDKRPVYRADALHEQADKQVLIVEGEKCADEGAGTLANAVAISWLGGAGAIEKTDWSVLRGRRVVLWPDNDAEGMAAMLGKYDRQDKWRRGLAEIAMQSGAVSVKVIHPAGEDMPKGWDLWDAVHTDGMTEKMILAWAADKTIVWTQAKTTARKQSLRAPIEHDPGEPEHPDWEAPPEELTPAAITTTQAKPDHAGSVPAHGGRPRRANIISLHGSPIPQPEVSDDWRMNLIYSEENKLKPRMNTNYKWMLRGHDDIRGVFAYNEIARDIFVVKRPPWKKANGVDWQQRKIMDDDVTETVGFLERQHLTPRPVEALAALAVVAKDYTYNPVQFYLKHLKWDGRPRLVGGEHAGENINPFVVEYFGLQPQDKSVWLYSIFFTRWMVSAVARALHPGCKADCAMVLESAQGFRKSTMLSALATVDGVSYFTDDVRDIENKDAALTMQGCWIIEIPELSSFQRKEADAIKSWLSRSNDRFRPPYQKMVADYPRQSVIAGTMNPSGSGYLRDPTGARRFWPIPVLVRIDVDRIIEERDQLWAEAVHLYRNGMAWYLTEAEARAATDVTGDRHEDDPWDEAIDAIITGAREITVEEVIAGLAIPRHLQNTNTSRRIAQHLQRGGWKKSRKFNKLIGKQSAVWIPGGEIDTTPIEGADDEGI